MAAIARTLRPFVRCTRIQKRWYADAPVSDQMKFTFAAANKVNFLSDNIILIKLSSFKNKN